MDVGCLCLSMRWASHSRGVGDAGTTAEQETPLQLIYKAVCETAHKITSRPDAVLDVAVCLVAAEFVLRRLLERPRP